MCECKCGYGYVCVYVCVCVRASVCVCARFNAIDKESINEVCVHVFLCVCLKKRECVYVFASVTARVSLHAYGIRFLIPIRTQATKSHPWNFKLNF